MLNKKTVLFGAPTNFGFSEAIKNELTLLGFHVVDFSLIQGVQFKYKCLGDRLYNCYRKVFFNDYEFKNTLRAKAHEEYLISILQALPSFDYGLFIRPDFFPINFIDKVKNKVDTMVGYQWDGLKRFPSIHNYVDLFDKFYVFDSEDLALPNTLPTTNFYFDSLINNAQNSLLNEAYFIGSYVDERMQQIIDLKQILNDNGFNDKIILHSAHSKGTNEILKNGFHHIPKYISYEENIKNTLNASLLIDIQNPIHNGLTFRAFESIGYDKKLITSNPEIANYDFYSPENIFIWNKQNTAEIKDFLSTPYQPLQSDIKTKYSFSNWIKYVFNMDEFIPIQLPHALSKTNFA